eukprot:13749839-Ditylum_brightwellii.AAC.1
MEVHAPTFMPHLWPLRAQLGNLNHKVCHAEWDPQKKQCGMEESKVGAPPLVFGGEEHRLVLHIDKGNATCNI